LPDVVIESTDAGCASTLFSLTNRRRDLRHHKSRIEAGASGEKRRQAFIQRWIDEALKPPLEFPRAR